MDRASTYYVVLLYFKSYVSLAVRYCGASITLAYFVASVSKEEV